VLLPRSWHAVVAMCLAATLALTLSPGSTAGAAETDGTIVGANGKTYPRSPGVVKGRNGDLFDGYTYDIVCQDWAAGVKADINRVGKLADVIAGSGRRVVVVVVPPKAVVNTANVVRNRLPHGPCDRTGLDQQLKLYDTYRSPHFLHIRAALAKAARDRQLFWKTDPHWTTVGASIYTKMLATRLDPALGRVQRFKRGPDQTAVGALTQLQGGDTPETVRSVVTKSAVTVTELPGTTPLDSPYVANHEWRSGPKKLTYPGRTLTIGDSMAYTGIFLLRPLFRRGQFLWANNPTKTMATAIRKADTVVLEVSHLFVRVSSLGTKALRAAVRRELAR
jgi:hypothetical protein